MRVPVLVTAFLVLTFAPALAAAQTPAGWKPFYYPDLHIVFMAPPQAAPTIQKAMIDVPNSNGAKATDDHITVLDAGHYAFMAGVSDWSANSQLMNIDGVPAGAVKGMEMEFTGPVRTLAWPNGQAREYDAHKGPLVVRARAIMMGRRLVQAMVLSDTGSLPPDADAFLASVKPLP